MDIITVEAALDEEYFDLDVGDRGFRIQVRPTTGVTSAVLRLSNIKGEVKKAITTDPKPVFWTIPADTHFESVLGIRLMEADAEKRIDVPIPYADIPDGKRTLQRWYVTSETAATEIEIMKVVGT